MVRFKYRYFTVKMALIIKKVPLGEAFYCKNDTIIESIRNKVKELHGDYGVAAIDFGLQVKYCNSCTQIVIIRVQHGAHRFVASALPFVKEVGTHPVAFQTLYVGASIRHCFIFVQRYQKLQLKKIWHLLSDEQKKDLKEKFSDIRFWELKKPFKESEEMKWSVM